MTDYMRISKLVERKRTSEHTISSGSKTSSACSRDITGLSNQALSSALMRPLLTLLEARPIRIGDRSGLSLRIRWAGTIPAVIAVSVTIAVTVSAFYIVEKY
jgi:hypothetical protein